MVSNQQLVTRNQLPELLILSLAGRCGFGSFHSGFITFFTGFCSCLGSFHPRGISLFAGFGRGSSSLDPGFVLSFNGSLGGCFFTGFNITAWLFSCCPGRGCPGGCFFVSLRSLLNSGSGSFLTDHRSAFRLFNSDSRCTFFNSHRRFPMGTVNPVCINYSMSVNNTVVSVVHNTSVVMPSPWVWSPGAPPTWIYSPVVR